MNKNLQRIVNIIQQDEHLSAEQKSDVLKSLKEADKELEIATFKLDRTEKIKRTTSILLEETIAELEQKRKAVEAQNHELAIEAALERVRAKTMAMQKSEELAEVAVLLYHELKALGLSQEFFECGYVEVDETNNIQRGWSTRPDGSFLEKPYYLPLTGEPVFDARYEAWSQRVPVFHQAVGGDQLKQHTEFAIPYFDNKEAIEISTSSSVPDPVHFYCSNFDHGYLNINCGIPLSAEEESLLARFTRVFEMTYTRFLDLQKAEAQAREAQIEAALERVRSRSMAMHQSDELKEVIQVVFEQLRHLNFKIDSAILMLDINETDDFHIWTATVQQTYPILIHVPYFNHPIYNSRKKEIADKVEFASEKLSFEDKNAFWHHFFKYVSVPKERQEYLLNSPGYASSISYFSSVALSINNYQGIPFSIEENAILKRFGKAFEQSYIRFLDLQKAEAQAREGQIQLALERVRARTMAMQKSEELPETSLLLFQQVKELGMTAVQNSIGIVNEEAGYVELSTTVQGHPEPKTLKVPIDDPYVMAKAVAAWKDKCKSLKLVFKGQELKNYNAHRNSFFETKVDFPEDQWVVNIIFFSKGWLSFSCNENIPDETVELLKRFGAVFEQTYTRFNDLKQAEEQAREAQIEAALEKIRSRSLAMHKSNELQEVIHLVFDRLKNLGLQMDSVSIMIPKENKRDLDIWVGTQHHTYTTGIFLPYTNFSISTDIAEARDSGVDFFTKLYPLEEKNEWWLYMFEHSGFKSIPEERKKFILESPSFIQSVAFAQKTEIITSSYSEKTLSSSEADILKRFARVFDQAYTRFLDLQRAEAQAREAQIEAALEKVRSRSLAMHHSNELEQVAGSLFDRLAELGLSFDGALIFVFDKGTRNISLWIATNHLSAPAKIDLPYDKAIENNTIIKELWHSIETGEHIINRSYSGKDKNDYFRYVARYNESKIPESIRQFQITTEKWTLHCAAEKNSLVGFDSWSGHITNDEDFKILIRFAKVFEQAYVRFLDLQKAEAQARESQIQLALERVRARTMAMQRSEELPEVAALLFQQVKTLGVPQFHCGFNIFEIDDKECTWYPGSADGDILPPCKIPLTEHPVFMNFIESRKRGDELCVYEKEGEYQAGHYRYMLSLPVLGEILQNMLDAGIPFPTFQIDHLANFSHGNLLFITSEHFPEMHDTFKRFAKVFEQTYTRFLDLQKAEAQALEAIKRASVDRVRAEIASMRTTKDLERITPLIWKELTILGIPFIRCGVFIMDESQRQIHTFLSTPDGRAIAAFHLPYDIPGRTSEILASWLNKEVYIEHWDEAAFSELGDLLVQQGSLPSKDVYMKTVPQGGLHLHCLPFLQGMLYVGNTIRLKSDEIQLIQSVADAFSTAYARYEDFNKLEAAKQQVDKTLVDLKQAQQQLVQSEKMASLGELTAGIAHEIQNPLNFVNNFSEVSNELIKELQEIRRNSNVSSDTNEEDELLKDIAGNLEKINHHGKRAGEIVKSMLQHSRASSGKKELTDINILADEYLRLAYHGLRAKDKSFNAKFETHLDPTLPKLNVIPQDIGRVLLNMINNAFYAVSEKSKVESQKSDSGYEPTVTVKTKKLIDKIEISVKDNGNGIPDSIKEKIFQPFFTTKPTGQGTGLGLSLSYDIVKAHGGEFKIETKEHEGSEFIISLSTN